MAQSTLPTEEKLGYKSESAFYGAKLQTDANGQMYLNYRVALAKANRVGDIVLRTTDDNVMKKPLALTVRHPKALLKQLARGPKRYRGTVSEILANTERLGLTDRYGAYTDDHRNLIGIAIKDNFLQEGRTLRNLYRAQRGLLEGASEFDQIDRFQALSDAVHFIRERHDKYGAFGEVNADDIIFNKIEDNHLKEPTFSVPDIVYNEKTTMSEREKRAIDVLDFMVDIAEEESNIGNRESVHKALETIITNYGEPAVIGTIKSFIKRGRLTLAGDSTILNQPPEDDRIPNLPDTITTRQRGLLSIHNQVRFRIKKHDALPLKRMIVDICDNFKNRENSQPQAGGKLS
ncbi:MAG TPA: hypothetical protein VEP90_11585 [Methylomirabilota bacterium]|nr:hypothetical protein [Methylomirabilota bacterium]